MNYLPSLSSIRFAADLSQDPLKYAKSLGHYPDFLEKAIQRLNLFSILTVVNGLSSTEKYITILKKDIRFLDYRSVASSSLHVVSSVFDVIRYAEIFEQAVGNYLKVSSSMIPTIDFIGKYILIGKISMGIKEIAESCVFLSELKEPFERKPKDHAEIQAYIRNTSEHVTEEVEKQELQQIKNSKICYAAKLALMKKVAQLAVSVIRLLAFFFLSNAVVIHTLLFACKLSKPVIEMLFTKPLAEYSVI